MTLVGDFDKKHKFKLFSTSRREQAREKEFMCPQTSVSVWATSRGPFAIIDFFQRVDKRLRTFHNFLNGNSTPETSRYRKKEREKFYQKNLRARKGEISAIKLGSLGMLFSAGMRLFIFWEEKSKVSFLLSRLDIFECCCCCFWNGFCSPFLISEYLARESFASQINFEPRARKWTLDERRAKCFVMLRTIKCKSFPNGIFHRFSFRKIQFLFVCFMVQSGWELWKQPHCKTFERCSR